jgi:hypothetical protein
MEFLIGPGQVYFSFLMTYSFLISKKVGIGCVEDSDPGIATVWRIFRAF